MTRIFGAALAGLLSALVAQPAQSGSAPFVLGVVYEGEIILPIARHTGSRWVNTWPGPEDSEGPAPDLKDVPVRWLGKRVPSQWTVWFTSGETAKVHVKGTELIAGCVTPPALSVAEHLSSPPGAFDDVHLGLAVDTAQRVQPLRRLDAGSEWDTINALVMSAAKSVGGGAAALRWLYRAGNVGGKGTYFFETTPTKSETPLVVRGWLVSRPDGRLVMTGAALVDCGNEEDGSLSCQIPIGVLRVGPHEAWVLESPTGETTSFEVWEVALANARRVLRYHAGGC